MSSVERDPNSIPSPTSTFSFSPSLADDNAGGDLLSLYEEATASRLHLVQRMLKEIEEKENTAMAKYEEAAKSLMIVRNEGRRLRELLGPLSTEKSKPQNPSFQPFKTLIPVPSFVPPYQWVKQTSPRSPDDTDDTDCFIFGSTQRADPAPAVREDVFIRDPPPEKSEVELTEQLSKANLEWARIKKIERFRDYERNLLAYLTRNNTTIPYPLHEEVQPNPTTSKSSAKQNSQAFQCNNDAFVKSVQEFVLGLVGGINHYEGLSKMLGDWIGVWRMVKGSLENKYRVALVVFAIVELLVQDQVGLSE